MHRPLRPKPTDAMLPTSRAFVSTGDAVGPRAVADDAGLRVGLLPEEHERPLRQILEQRVVCGRQGDALRGAPARLRTPTAAARTPVASSRRRGE